MKIILLCGWSGSGKDATASILVNKYGYKRYAFADQLKDIASAIYGFPRDMADSQEGKQNLWPCGFEKKTIRDLLLLVGKVERERFGLDIYVRGVVDELKKLPDNSKIVISDLRYPAELAYMKMFARDFEYSIEVWKIVRKDQEQSPVNHESENLMESFHHSRILENPGTTILDLEEVIESIQKNSNALSSEECSIM